MSLVSLRRLAVFALPLLVAFGVAPMVGAQTVFADGIEIPQGLAQLSDGRVLVTSFGGNAVLAFAADGTPLGTFATDIADPVPIVQLGDGRVLVGEFNEGVVRSFSADGTDLGVFASDLEGPVDIAQLSDGTILVSENYTPGALAFTPTGETLGRYVESVTESGAAFGTTQLADGRILLTVSGPFEAVQVFSGGGGFLGTLALATDGLTSVGSVRQLADGRVVVLDTAAGEVEGFTTGGASLGVIATIPNIITDLIQLADGRVLVSDVDSRVYEIAVTTDAEPGAGAGGVRLSLAPNPARGASAVRLTLDAPGAVVVDVLDALGRTVTSLHDGPLAAGTHTLRLDAARLPAGAYIVRVGALGGVGTQRLTVVR